MSGLAIEVAGLEKSYGSEAILEDVDLSVDAGELLVVMGPNGVGKSVLFSCLAGSQRPTAGRVDVFGEPATARADTTSFLLQDAVCADRLTGRQNVRFYDQLHPYFTDDWREFVERLGLEDDLDKKVEHYSGRMKRKLELAIALSVDVPIYLLDEPTASLDLGTIQTVHGLLREKQAAGKTVVVSSHSPIDADLADRIAFVAGGRVVATGAPEALLESVPPVLETTLRNAGDLEAVSLDGEVFPGDGGVRGFLPPDRSVDAIGNDADLDGVRPVDRPSYTDLFNYYSTHGGRDEPSRAEVS